MAGPTPRIPLSHALNKLDKQGGPRTAESDNPNIRYRKDGTTWIYSPPLAKRGVSRKIQDAERKMKIPKTDRLVLKVPMDIDEQNLLGDEMVAWSLTPEAETIEQFPLKKGFAPQKFYRLAENNEYFSDCFDVALSRLGSKMHSHARKWEQDGAVIMKTFPLYNRMYRQLALDKANALSAKVDTIIQVVEEQVPSSPLVPSTRLVNKDMKNYD